MASRPEGRTHLSELALFLMVATAAAIMITVLDSLLLQRAQAFFGGGAQNRPFHVSGLAETSGYLAISFAYDLVYLLVIGFIVMQGLRLFGFHPGQRLLVGTTVAVGGALGFAMVNYRIAEYFKDKFDLAVLRELAGGRLVNMFGWISGDTFQALLAFPVILLAFAWLVRRIGRARGALLPLQSGRRAALAMVPCVALLGMGHIALVQYPNMRFGMSNKMSFKSLDVALRAVDDYDRSPVLAAAQERLRLATGAPPDAPPVIEAANGMNVFIIVIETFRSEVVDQRIGGEPVMPFFSALARGNAYTDFAVSNYGVTARAIQTIMSGSLAFHAQTDYLPEQLRRLGYRRHAVSAQNESFGDTRQRLRFDGFDSYFESSMHDWHDEDLTTWQRMNRISLTLDSRLVNERVFRTLDEDRGTPFFFYVNFQDLHYPYYGRQMPLRFITEGRTDASFFTAVNAEAIRAQYANAARYLDDALRSFFDGLAERGLLERSVVVIVGDHPDSFYENGLLGHAWSVDESQRRTPLLVVNGRGTLSAPVGQDEIFGMIRTTLRPDGGAPPMTIGRVPEKEVFEVSGPLDAPRQIAFLGEKRLVTYDFRTDRVQFAETGRWVGRRSLAAGSPEQQTLQRLLATWEQHFVQQARDAARPHGPTGASVTARPGGLPPS